MSALATPLSDAFVLVALFDCFHECAIRSDNDGAPLAAHVQVTSLEVVVADDVLAIGERVRLVAVVCCGATVQHQVARHGQVHGLRHGRLLSSFDNGADAKPAEHNAHDE